MPTKVEFLSNILTFNTLPYKRILICCALLVCLQINAQSIVSLNTLLDSCLKNSPLLKSSESAIKREQKELKSAFNLPSPELLLQNPTGNFYTFGVQQILDFPTVYGKQRLVQKENIKLAESMQKWTFSDLKYKIHVLYTEFQYHYQMTLLWNKQDSAYKKIAENADKAFQAGSIDYLQSGFAQVQASQVHMNYNLSKAAYTGVLEQLKILSGIKEDFIPDSLTNATEQLNSIIPDTSSLNNYSIAFYKQQLALDEMKVKLEKNKVLPGFTVAYLNQGDKGTPFQNRFYAGLRIPLWFWQYKGNIDAAKYQVEVSAYNAEANEMQLSSEMKSAYIKYLAYLEALVNYRTDVLQNAMKLSNASDRFYVSGNISYTEHLRILNEANEIQKSYCEILKNYKQTLVYLLYLNGSL